MPSCPKYSSVSVIIGAAPVKPNLHASNPYKSDRFHGRIQTFHGKVQTFHGKIQTFHGKIEMFTKFFLTAERTMPSAILYLQSERDLSSAGMYTQRRQQREVYQSPACIYSADSRERSIKRRHVYTAQTAFIRT